MKLRKITESDLAYKYRGVMIWKETYGDENVLVAFGTMFHELRVACNYVDNVMDDFLKQKNNQV